MIGVTLDSRYLLKKRHNIEGHIQLAYIEGIGYLAFAQIEPVILQ